MNTTKSQARRTSAAFTLVELLTVITIIVMLVAITIGVLSFAQKKAIETKAYGQLSLLQTALDNYYEENKEYPEPVDNSGEGWGGAKALYQALSGDGDNHLELENGTGASSTGRIGEITDPYMEGLDPNANKHGLVAKASGGGFQLADPYGQPWFYRVDLGEEDGEEPVNNKGSYDLWSVGQDSRKENEAKWIKNWGSGN